MQNHKNINIQENFIWGAVWNFVSYLCRSVCEVSFIVSFCHRNKFFENFFAALDSLLSHQKRMEFKTEEKPISTTDQMQIKNSFTFSIQIMLQIPFRNTNLYTSIYKLNRKYGFKNILKRGWNIDFKHSPLQEKKVFIKRREKMWLINFPEYVLDDVYMFEGPVEFFHLKPFSHLFNNRYFLMLWIVWESLF